MGGDGSDDAGDDQQAGQRPDHDAPVDAARHDGRGETGNGADNGGRGHRLPGRADGDADIGGHRGEQARRQELGRDEAEDAEGQGCDGRPGRLVAGLLGCIVEFKCSGRQGI